MSVTPSGAVSGLLERAGSLAALDELLSGVRSTGQGRLVLVGGEAGVGKTALLRTFCDAQAGSARMLWGACEPLQTPHPLGPLLDVAEATGGELRDLVRAAARPHEVAGALLAELRTRPLTLLVVEDLHWADEATLDVVVLVAARIGSAPSLVLGSFRDDEIDATTQFRFLLGELVRRPGRLKVERLSREAVMELAAPHRLDGDELFRGTGGNPFFVTEVIAAGGERVPETVRDAVLARAARLSAPARKLLEAVAVVPGQVEPWLLEAMAGDLEDRVDECLASGILVAGRTDIAFRHDLAAQYSRALRSGGELAPGVRAELLDGRVEECRLSAQFDEAIRAQEEALDCYRRLGDRAGEGDALRSLSRLLFFAARTGEGERAGQEAIALLEQLPPGRGLAMAYANLAQRRMVVEDYDETLAWGTRALELARLLKDDEVLVYALTSVGAAELDAGDPGNPSTLERALSLADRLGLEDHVGRAFALLVIYDVRTRRFELADTYLESGLAYCTERGLDTPRGYLLAHRAAGTTFTKRQAIYTAPKKFDGFNGIAFGADGRLYVGVDVGLTDGNDHGPAKTPYVYDILSIKPNGQGLKAFATGIRQPWQMVFPAGSSSPYVSDLGQDSGARNPPDFVLRVHQGDNYGFPSCNWTNGAECTGFAKPFQVFGPHTDIMGMTIIGQRLYMTSFLGTNGKGPGGEVVSMPLGGGALTPVVKGFVAPTVGLGVHGGSLYVGEVGPGLVFKVTP